MMVFSKKTVMFFENIEKKVKREVKDSPSPAIPDGQGEVKGEDIIAICNL